MNPRDLALDRPHAGSGLIFSGQPAPHARSAEMSARRALEHDCDACGEVGAGCFAFASFVSKRGLWACRDLDCRDAVEARAEALRAAGEAVEPQVVERAGPAGDLFSFAMAGE